MLEAVRYLEAHGGERALKLLQRIRSSGAKVEFKFDDRKDYKGNANTDNVRGPEGAPLAGQFILKLNGKYRTTPMPREDRQKLLAANLAHELFHVYTAQTARGGRSAPVPNCQEEFAAEMFAQEALRKLPGGATQAPKISREFDAKTMATMENGTVAPAFSQFAYFETFERPDAQKEQAYLKALSTRYSLRKKDRKKMGVIEPGLKADPLGLMVRYPFHPKLYQDAGFAATTDDALQKVMKEMERRR
jgi:hypothetical protein